MKDLDKPKESAEQRASRMWGNYDLTKRFLDELEKKKNAPKPIKTEPDIAEVIVTERPKADSLTKFQSKFIRDFKTMLEDHKRRNVALYRIANLTRLQKLRAERDRRLALMAQQPSPKKDLFS
jgi:hypothetical protein